MQINAPERVPVAALRPSPDNPKDKIGKQYLAGLRASIERYGFSGTLSVGANLDGTFVVLDGNTRLDELLAAKIVETWVCRVPACAEGVGDWASERKQFTLAYDRHRKKFSETAVLEQLKALAAKGEDVKQLALLSGKANLSRLLAESQAPKGGAAGPASTAPTQASLVLYGPMAEIQTIGGLLKHVKGKLSTLEKARKALGQSVEFLAWDDARLLSVLLATVAKFGETA